MTSIFDVRRENLISLIRDSYQNNRAEFSRSTGKNPNLINLVLSNNEEYRRNIGEKLARDLESRCGIATGWLDAPRGIGIRRVTRIPILTDAANVPDKAPLESDYHVTLPVDDPALALRSTGTSNLAIVIANESCMAPTFHVGDLVWVDLGVKKISGDGIYVIRVAGGTVFRRIQQLPTGEVRLSTDDPVYAPQILKGKALSGIRIIGKSTAVSRRTAL